MRTSTIILGAGATGLAAGVASKLPVYEALDAAGGICSSYYVRTGSPQKLSERSAREEEYRFEIGGGHWIFGGDTDSLEYLRGLANLKSYARDSSVFFPSQGWMIPFPIQNNLSFFPSEIAQKAFREITLDRRKEIRTFDDWLFGYFGETLYHLFFAPFHELYTAGLWKTIAPQDSFKSPLNLEDIKAGIEGVRRSTGYNSRFLYPEGGLGKVFRRMSEQADVRFKKQAIAIDVQAKEVHFSDGTSVKYDALLSTLPLNRMMELASLSMDSVPDPYTSVLVVNIGGRRGARCPSSHWVYVPHSTSGFHRVGFYSNVDAEFLPERLRLQPNAVSMYVEKSFRGGTKLSEPDMRRLSGEMVAELVGWEFLHDAEVIDPTWIDVAYTWSMPGSQWREDAITLLAEQNIFQIGRYGRWIFQGIADSIRDGLAAGRSFSSATKFVP